MANFGDVTCDSCKNTFKVNLTDIENKQFNECPFCHQKLTDQEKEKLKKHFQEIINKFYAEVAKNIKKNLK